MNNKMEHVYDDLGNRLLSVRRLSSHHSEELQVYADFRKIKGEYAKMKILRNTQRVMTFMGYLSDDQIFPIKYAISSFVFIAMLALLALSWTVGLELYLEIGDYENSLYNGFQLAFVIPRIISFGSMMYQKDKIRDVIDGFQKISDKCESKPSAIFFKRADRLSEKYLLYASAFVIGGFVTNSVIFAILSGVYQYMQNGQIEFDRVYSPFRISSPFNENTFAGWTIVFCLKIIARVLSIIASTTTTTFLLAIGLYFEACSLHFRNMLVQMNGFKNESSTDRAKFKLKESLADAIRFHNEVKSIFIISRQLLSATIFFDLCLGILNISLLYSSLEIAAAHLNLNAVVWAVALQTCTGTILLYCYTGSLTTHSFLRYGDAVYEFDWFKMPIELRKFIQLIIADAQRPLVYTGLNLVDLNLLTFVKLAKTVFTYYMMFRRLVK